MAAVFLEPGGDADFGFTLWSATANTPTIVTDFVHGGHLKSIKFAPSTAQQVTRKVALADAGSRFSCWIYLNHLPNGNTTVPFVINQSADVNTVFTINITAAGVLQLADDAGTQIGTNGQTLLTGFWYRISCAYTITSTSVNQFRIFVNGVLSISVTNGTLHNVTSSLIHIGNNNTDTLLDFRLSDFYCDNSSALTDPGNIWVTAKRPLSNGTTNGFTTQIGSGGSGYGTGHAPQVNERASSDTNGWSFAVSGSAITEEYNIEAKNIGDIDISQTTIVDYMGWIRSKSLSSETASIVVNGVSSNVALTSTITTFIKMAGSATYPAGTGTDIGEVTSTTVTTVSLYEAGIVVAYIPPSTANFFPMFVP